VADPADLPESCQVDQITADWLTAVHAWTEGDREAALDAICPRTMCDREAFTRLRGFLFLGAAACGAEIRKQDPSPLGIWGFDLIENATGERTDPSSSPDAANATALARMVIASANHDYDTVLALGSVHLPPGSGPERVMVVFDLIALYGALTDQERAA